jgi:hypothetical protein
MITLDFVIEAVSGSFTVITMFDGEKMFDFECESDIEIGRDARGSHFPPLADAPMIEESVITPEIGV